MATKKAGAKKAAKKTSKKASGKKAASSKKGGPVNCGKWAAWHDHMPPGPAKLYVTGECTTPTPGWKIKLVPAVPQGINPKILLLNKVVTPPKGIRPQVLTKVEVRFTKRTNTEYTKVTILPDGKTIRVREVS